MGSDDDQSASVSIAIHALSEAEEEEVLYAASFADDGMAESFVRYQTARWVLYSLLLLPAWGLGLLMLLCLPLRLRHCRAHTRSRQLHLTPHAIVYKASTPPPIPCFPHPTIHNKYIILPSIADVSIEQGCLQSYFGVYSIRIAHKGLRRPATDDLNIQGVARPTLFQKAVLTQLSSIKNEQLSIQPSTSSAAPLGDLILQKLDEVEGSLKKVHALIDTRACTPQILD